MRLIFWNYTTYSTIMDDEMKNNSYDVPSVTNNTKAGVRGTQLSNDGELLFKVLMHAKSNSKARAEVLKGKTYLVSGVGGTIGNTYEKIRNSTEYTEDHLLLQRAIRRYLYRNLFIDIRINDPQLVEEMVVELTHGGYLPENSVTTAQINELGRIIAKFYAISQKMSQSGTSMQKIQVWVMDVLSVECEWVFNDPSYLLAYSHFAQRHILTKIGAQYDDGQAYDDTNEISFIYHIAVLRNLLKADRAAIRTMLMEIYKVPQTASSLTKFNEHFDVQFVSETMKTANVVVNRTGAPLRILYSAFFENTKHDPSIVHKPAALLSLIDENIRFNYRIAERKLNNGIVKSIIFLIITKVLIGIAIEVPVDIWLYGSIIWLPLLINLLAPPLFIIFQRLTLRVPGERNTEAIKEYVRDMLYADNSDQNHKSIKTLGAISSTPWIFGAVYALASLVIFSFFVWRLVGWGFNPVQLIIFFVFLSTATFLGFRLSLVIKDLELVRANQNLLGAVRDFIYTPFIILGQWLSGKYAQFNIISLLLDFAIELPLKTVLRHARQWMRFLDEKKETLG